MSVYLQEAELSKVRQNLEIYNVQTSDGQIEHELHHYKCRQSVDDGALTSIPLVLLVHGFGEHVGMMESFILRIISNEDRPADCLVYNHRSHGPKFMRKDKVACMELDVVSEDLLTVCTFINDKFIHSGSRRNFYLLGNSMGGAIILNTAIKYTSEFCELNVRGVIFENPYIQVHSNQANFFLRGMIHLLGSVIPNFVVPKAIDVSGITHCETHRKNIESDPFYQFLVTFKTAKNMLQATNWIYANLKSWPKEVPYNLHISTEDVIVDHLAAKEFAFATSSYSRNNTVFYYKGAKHGLKSEIPKYKDVFVANVCSFLQ